MVGVDVFIKPIPILYYIGMDPRFQAGGGLEISEKKKFKYASI